MNIWRRNERDPSGLLVKNHPGAGRCRVAAEREEDSHHPDCLPHLPEVPVENRDRKIYRNLNEIGQILSDVMIRHRRGEVLHQLPARMDKILFVPMTEEQRWVHDECAYVVAQIVAKWRRFGHLSEQERQRLLILLNQMRMVCDSTFILDQENRHDTKVEEVMNIVEEVVSEGEEKLVIFSQWERMTRLVAQELDGRGIGYEYLHGGVPGNKRGALYAGFTHDPWGCRGDGQGKSRNCEGIRF